MIGIGFWIVESYFLIEIVLVCNDVYWGDKFVFGWMELKVVFDEFVCVNVLWVGELDVIGGDWVVVFLFCRVKVLEGEGMVIVVEFGMVMMIFGFLLKFVMM